MAISREAKARYDKQRRKAKAAQVALGNRATRLKREEYYRKRSEERNRRLGHAPRPKGPKALRRVRVSKSRKFTIIDDRVYFNRETGFTREELVAILAECDAHTRI